MALLVLTRAGAQDETDTGGEDIADDVLTRDDFQVVQFQLYRHLWPCKAFKGQCCGQRLFANHHALPVATDLRHRILCSQLEASTAFHHAELA